MSDGITLYCPSCGKLTALKKEYDELKVKLSDNDFNLYDSSIPVYTCQNKECRARSAIEQVVKKSTSFYRRYEMKIGKNLLWMLLGSNYMFAIIISGFVWGTLRYIVMLGIFIIFDILMVKYGSPKTNKPKDKNDNN